MFKSRTAWFSKSVSKSKRQKWLTGGGTEASFDDAQFIFSQDSGYRDTRRIFESTAYLDEHLTVFHANFISECVKKQSMQTVPLNKYILLPEDIQEVLATRSGWRVKFLWQTDGNTSDNQPENSESEDETPGPQMTNKTSQKGSLEPDQEATTSSKIKNQAGSISNDKQKENHSEQNQNTEVQSNTRTHEESTEDQSNTRTHEKSTEDQSNTRTHEKSSEDQSNARTQEKSSEDQSNTRTHEKSIKIKQSNQSNITSPSKNTHKAVQVNTPNKETKNREQQISKESKMVEKEVRRSPRKRGQTNTEDQSPEKIQRVSDSSVATAEREEVWRVENLAKVMDEIDEFVVGTSGYVVFEKR